MVHFDEVSSTQDVAAELARGGAAEGTLVIAEMQTKGRGRKGRSWTSLSPRRNIFFSHFKTKAYAIRRLYKFPSSRELR